MTTGAESAMETGPAALEKNAARLYATQPGAARAMAWLHAGPPIESPALNDGDRTLAARLPPETLGVGIEWPIQHMLDGAALFWGPPPPSRLDIVIECHNGVRWVPLTTGLREESGPDPRCRRWSFEPVATRALRMTLPPRAPAPSELEVYRYLPESSTVWPDRLVNDNRLEKEILAAGREPSYETLATCALSMTPAHALLGLKDHPREIGVTWDGRLVSPKFDPHAPLALPTDDYKQTHSGKGHYTLSFTFGERQATLADYRDTVSRTLMDGWRPGTVVAGRINDLSVRQTAFMSFAGEDRTRPALFVRIEVENLAGERVQTTVNAHMLTKAGDILRVADGCLADGDWLVLAASTPPRAADIQNALRFDLDLAPGQALAVTLVQPHGQTALGDAKIYRSARFDAARETFTRYWDDILAPAMKLDLPESRLNNLYKAVLTQLFINADGDIMPYGSDPSVYAGNLYGIEEAYAMLALAFSGFDQDAQRYLGATYLTSEFLKKVPEYKVYAHRHQQYRNGLQPSYAVSAFRVSRDEPWIRKHLPLLRACAEWTLENRRKTMTLEDGKKPLHWGLLPKWSFGGDVSELQTYTFYANFACWKGLMDTVWLLEELGDTDTARHYREEAVDYRACIDRAVEGNFLPEHQPPCLPLSLYVTEPEPEPEFYQLFAGLLLDLLPFDLGGRHERFITDFLEQNNRTFCLMPRFRRTVGAGGLDGLYGVGYVLSKLHQDKIDEFLLAFYGYLAFNMERETFASRETNLIYASDFHVRFSDEVPNGSDPLPCSSAVALNYLRHLLVTEELSGPGLFSGNLLVLFGAPRAWFQDGKTIAFSDASTHFGKMSCTVISAVAHGRMEALIRPPARNAWSALKVRLRHPDGLPIRRVSVNGQPWLEVDAKRELISLQPGADTYRVAVEYGPVRKRGAGKVQQDRL
jgi:hypothetical protein